MTEQEQKNLAAEVGALCVFRGILKKEPMRALLSFLTCEGPTAEKMARFGAFVYTLSEDGYCFSDFLLRAVYTDENRYIVGKARGEALPEVLLQNAKEELALFSRLTQLSADSLCEPLAKAGYVPQFLNRPVSFETAYAKRLSEVSRLGYGVFAEARMFRVTGEEIVPVRSADDITLDTFVGYERERQQVLDNTKALLEGRPAANVLLFGDAGTGKSSTVKACANFFAPQGVRLIELRKDQLFSLSSVMGQIRDNPLKFILFIDDLSFQKNDDSFSMLKAALEGSASAKAKNCVIYATSNRRHIVKESFSDRDDVHHGDTVQELMSLSDRFGLTVYFEKPTKPLYLDIVRKLAARNGIPLSPELELRAETFALAKGSRSPRAAEQFVDSLTASRPTLP